MELKAASWEIGYTAYVNGVERDKMFTIYLLEGWLAAETQYNGKSPKIIADLAEPYIESLPSNPYICQPGGQFPAGSVP